MLYPRVNEKGKLVFEDQMVGAREHLAKDHRILTLSGAISNEMESIMLMMALDSISHEPIKFIITSPGGDLDAAFLFYDTMRLLQSPIETYGRYCASAAVIPLAAGSKRYLSPHAKVMLHLPSTYFRDVSLEHKDLEICQREAQKYKQKTIDILIECGASKSHDEILADIDHDFWMEPEEAIAYGLADEIMTSDVFERWVK